MTGPIRVVALDIDGTLVDSRGAIPEANLHAIGRATDRGVRVVLATGRAFLSTLPVARQLQLNTPLVCDNGALIRDVDGRERWARRIGFHTAREIASWADAGRHPMIIVVDDTTYHTWPEDWAREGWRPRPHDRVVSSSLGALTAPPLCMMAAGAEAAQALLDDLAPQYKGRLRFDSYKRGTSLFLALAVHSAASKKNALARLCAEWRLHPSQVMAMGDNLLDLEMMRWAGIGVIMDNSPPEMHSSGQWIAPSNDEAGVAWAIERFVLGVDGREPATAVGT